MEEKEESEKSWLFKDGNQFWKKRSKHGRDRIIESAEFLAKAADEYFIECENNPIIELDFKGMQATEVKLPHPRPFLKGEFARFCGCAGWDTINMLKDVSKDFLEVIENIEGVIRDRKYTYAIVGMFNATIVSRDLGLVDKKDVTSKGKNINDISGLSTEELVKRAEAAKKIES